MDEMLEMRRNINYTNLVYDFKSPTTSINFIRLNCPLHTFDQLKKGKKKHYNK